MDRKWFFFLVSFNIMISFLVKLNYFMFMSLVKGNTLNILFSHTTDLQKKKMTNSKLVFYKKKKNCYCYYHQREGEIRTRKENGKYSGLLIFSLLGFGLHSIYFTKKNLFFMYFPVCLFYLTIFKRVIKMYLWPICYIKGQSNS